MFTSSYKIDLLTSLGWNGRYLIYDKNPQLGPHNLPQHMCDPCHCQQK